MASDPEQTLEIVREMEGTRLKVREERVRLADGTESFRDIVDHPNSVVIVPMADDGTLMMVRQFRKALGHELLELPAGVIEEAESPAVAARRELREEIGYSASKLSPLGSFFAAPGSMNEQLFAFLATGLTWDPLPADQDERIEVVRMPFSEVIGLARSGQIHDAKTLCALFLSEGNEDADLIP